MTNFISIFGVLSLVVAVVAGYAMYLHFALMKMRIPLEDARRRIDMLLDDGEDISQVVTEYNHAVVEYNRYIRGFPGVVMATIVGFQPEAYYELE